MLIDYLLKQACERCEEHSANGYCECRIGCPVYGLYVEASKKTKVIYKKDTWGVPPVPPPEML